jgi:hypothetical protein
MRNFLTVTVIAGACVLAPAALTKNDKNDRDTNNNPPSSTAQDQTNQNTKKVLAAKSGGLLNSDATPAQARKMAEATNRQILERQRHR